jgi:hypothetical protein
MVIDELNEGKHCCGCVLMGRNSFNGFIQAVTNILSV